MQKWAKALGIFSIIISEIVGLTVAGVYLGVYLRDHHRMPELTIFLTGTLGFIVSLIIIIKVTDREK